MSPDERDEKTIGAAKLTGAGRTGDAGGGPSGPGAGPALEAARALLARRTRELVEAVVLSDVAIVELGAVAAEIGSLAERLGAQRPGPIGPEAGPGLAAAPAARPGDRRGESARAADQDHDDPGGNRTRRVQPGTCL